MSNPMQSLIAAGTKVWLDSIDPEEIRRNLSWGASGATSNPIIIADLIKTGRFDADLMRLMRQGLNDTDLAWQLTDQLVREAQAAFRHAYDETHGDDGYVSFELDPLLEDPAVNMPVKERTRHYIELARKWTSSASILASVTAD